MGYEHHILQGQGNVKLVIWFLRLLNAVPEQYLDQSMILVAHSKSQLTWIDIPHIARLLV